MVGHLLHLVRAGLFSRPGFLAHVKPGLDARKNRLKSVFLQTFQMRFRQERQRAFGNKVDTIGWNGRLDCPHIFLKSDAKVGIMPSHDGPFYFGPKELQIFTDLIKGQGLIVHMRIHAKPAGIRTAHAADHRHDLKGGGCLG